MKDMKSKGTVTQERNIWSTSYMALCIWQCTHGLKSLLSIHCLCPTQDTSLRQPQCTAKLMMSTSHSLPVQCVNRVVWCGAQTNILSLSVLFRVVISIIMFWARVGVCTQPTNAWSMHFSFSSLAVTETTKVMLYTKNDFQTIGGATAHTKH